jgi:Na+-driven multidrug efflux pump
MKQQYKEYLKLNKNILLGFLASIVVSAVVAQMFSNQQNYVNATITLAVDYVVYFSAFGGLFYIDNKKKYLLKTGEVDKAGLRKDLVKVIFSLGIGEIIYTICRWTLQYYLLTNSYQAYAASLTSQSISTVIYMISVNLSVKFTRLYKDGS